MKNFIKITTDYIMAISILTLISISYFLFHFGGWDLFTIGALHLQ